MDIKLFLLSIKDFFSPKYLKLTLIPFIGSSVIMLALFFTITNSDFEILNNATLNIQQVQTTNQNGIVSTDTTNTTIEGTNSLIDFLSGTELWSWVADGLFYVVLAFLFATFSILIAVVIIGFMTPLVVKMVGEQYYPEIQREHFGSMFDMVFMLLKTVFVMMMLYFIFIPLYFIPILGTIALSFPLYYFFHKMLVFDVGTNLMSRVNYTFMKITHKSELRIGTLLMYVISMIPLIGLFLSLFYVIYITHLEFKVLQHLNKKSN